MSFGAFYIDGLQTGTAAGNQQSLGPYAIPFSDTVDTNTYTVNTAVTIPVPTTADGVWIIPPLNSGLIALQFKTVPGDTGTFISPDSPSYIGFDDITPNIPANLYLVSAGSVQVTIQFV